MIQLKGLATETQNEKTKDLDQLSITEILTIMNEEDNQVPKAIKEVIPEIEQAVQFVVTSFKVKGRLIYMGAGTSGRLGVLDAVECPPTFGTTPEQVVGLIAGGEKAFVKAVEGAEDSFELGALDLKNIQLTANDTVIGIAASGRTPYVIGGFDYAKMIGAKTVAIACNKDSKMASHADLAIEVSPGPEVLTGSTRLKAGTSQKLILNMISTTSMIQMGKVYQNYMVDVQQTNEKLCVRAQNIVMDTTSCTRECAKENLEAANGSVKLAIVMILLHCDVKTALKKLDETAGHVRAAIK